MITGEYLAAALEAHVIFVERLENWHRWLRGGYRPYNSEALMLHRLIQFFIDLRSPGGAWENENQPGLPSLAEMQDAIGLNSSSSRYRQFETEVEARRKDIEEAAYRLVQLLNSELFIDEFDTLSLDQQIIYASVFSEHLSASQIGLSYMVSTLTTSHPSGKQHVLSLDRFLEDPRIFTPDAITNPSAGFAVARRMAKAYAAFHFNMVPALMVDFDIARFSTRLLNFIFKYFSPNQLNSTAEEVFDTVAKVENLLIRVRNFAERNPQLFPNVNNQTPLGNQAIAHILIIVELANVYIAVLKLRENLTVRATWDLGSSVAGLTSAMVKQIDALTKSSTLKLAARRLAGWTVLFTAYDVVNSTISVSDAWKDNDLSVATGHALKGLGFCGLLAVAILGAASLPLSIFTFGSVLLIFGGEMLVQYTQDPPLLKWFEGNYFGTNWANVDTDEGPPDLNILYKFKHPDRTPDIARQVASVFSMLYPINCRVDWNSLEPDRLTLLLVEPPNNESLAGTGAGPLITFHAEIAIKRIVDQGDRIPERYDSIYIYQAPIAHLNPLEEDLDPVRLHRPTTPQPNDRLEYWSRPFTFFELSGNSNPNFDPVGQYFEIEILPNDRISATFTGITGTTGLLEALPVVLRKCFPIPARPN